MAQAKNRSAREGKMIYVSFTANWCLPCQMMKEGAYKDQRVNYMLHNGMIPVLADEANHRSKEWFARYEVTSLPLTLVLDASGNVLERLEGFKSAESIRIVLDRYSSEKTGGSNLNNVPIVFKSEKKLRQVIPTPTPAPTLTPPSYARHSSIPAVVEATPNNNNITDVENETALYPTIYGIQLSSFNSIYDASEYQEYINKHFSKESIILTSDDEKVFKIIFTCNSLKEAKEQIKTFKKAEVNCFIRVL